MELFHVSYVFDCLWIAMAVWLLKLARRFASDRGGAPGLVEARLCLQA
ncbi:MAG TPA: hypothetical protein P5279_16070 [Anaerohalosphaeraceae bacterium]|nr:hypothetical protein [Anaerohalosphaeraceae bacterium]HRT52006.1 hypothetical protein [Anaerohalosphaeraceae bacterium]HRT88069.1 hypothetical protein [Anaerohalosphaeraceae bacterium]